MLIITILTIPSPSLSPSLPPSPQNAVAELDRQEEAEQAALMGSYPPLATIGDTFPPSLPPPASSGAGGGGWGGGGGGGTYGGMESFGTVASSL